MRRQVLCLCGAAMLLLGCQGKQPVVAGTPAEQADMKARVTMPEIVFLTRDGCSNTPVMRERLDAAIVSLGGEPSYEVINQSRLPAVDPRTGYATPTVLVDSRDLFGLPTPRMPFAAPS